nr:hypothetical protein BgiMline_021639 [Biomphalaria glabrata]
MTYTTLTLTFFVLIALYWNVDSIEKRQMTRLETKCRRYENYTYLRFRNAEKCMIWLRDTFNYLDALKSCQDYPASNMSKLFDCAKYKLMVYHYKFYDQDCFLDAPYICEIRLN